MSKRRASVEQELFSMIYKLIDKKTSQIFRQPVDRAALPDYYEKIKNPMDISKIISKMKTGQYQYSSEVKEDFKLLIDNCKKYNVRIEILRLADKFDKSIDTEWGNFEKQCRKEMLDWSGQRLDINQEAVKVFQTIQEKYNRKPQMLHNILGELEQPKRQAAQLKILPEIPHELLHNDKQGQDLPAHLAFQPLKYSSMTLQQKTSKLNFSIDTPTLTADFQQASKKKLTKYRKILSDKLQWLDKKIFRKCMTRKLYKRMATIDHLVSYLQNDKLINYLQLRNIQMYVKMASYWIEEYPQILSFYMKNKFVDTCKAIRRAIFRVLRYRKQPRSTKIQVDLNQALDHQMPSAQAASVEPGMDELPEEQSRRYDNQIKNFKRLLTKDQSQTIKKWTKITIKNDNGEWIITDFSSESNVKNPKRPPVSRISETTDESKRLQKQKRRIEEKQEDELFLSSFKTGNSVELVSSFRDKLHFDWDQVLFKQLPEVVEFNVQNLIST